MVLTDCVKVDHLSLQGKSTVVFYGSQTGTAEEFAARLAKDSNRYTLKAMVADPEECDMVSGCYNCVLCTTYQREHIYFVCITNL